MTLKDFKDWLKTQIDCPNWYIGKIDGNKDNCMGIYNTQGPEPNLALGGVANTSYSTKAISILIHWGKNPDLAEQKALEVNNVLFGQVAIINNKRVINFNLRTAEPIFMGTDSNGIFEYVINVNIITER